MDNADFDPSGPAHFSITSSDWWVKVLEMLQHNWALIEESSEGFTLYFFHDLGTTRGLLQGFTLKQLRNRCAVVDSLEFSSLEEARTALLRNNFERLEDNPGPWDGFQPSGNFYDARSSEEGIYSKAGYWVP